MNIKRRKAYLKKYRKSKVGKENARKRAEKYQKTKKGKEVRIKYLATEGYKKLHKKDTKKCNYKRRNLGFHPISLPLNVPFDWHHVNKRDVVATPRHIHRVISHVCGDGKIEGVLG